MPWRRRRFPIIATITFIALITCAVLVSAFVWMEATPDKAPPPQPQQQQKQQPQQPEPQQLPQETPLQR
jgi:hypothetical protein